MIILETKDRGQKDGEPPRGTIHAVKPVGSKVDILIPGFQNSTDHEYRR